MKKKISLVKANKQNSESDLLKVSIKDKRKKLVKLAIIKIVKKSMK